MGIALRIIIPIIESNSFTRLSNISLLDLLIILLRVRTFNR